MRSLCLSLVLGLTPLLLDPYGDGAADGHERIESLTELLDLC